MRRNPIIAYYRIMFRRKAIAFAAPAVVFLLKPLVRFRRFYNIATPLERTRGFARAIRKGDTVVQAGVCMDTFNSQIFELARLVGPNGKVVAIEPDPGNLEKLKAVVGTGKFGDRFRIVPKATYAHKGTTKMDMGRKTTDNMISSMPDSRQWKRSDAMFKQEQIPIEMDTIDNILADLKIEPHQVSFVNLTINGAEYGTLQGMTVLLRDARNLTVAVTAGREYEGFGKDDIGFINGKPDHEMVAEYLRSFEFATRFRRFRVGKFGYVIGTKGDKKIFM